MRLVNYHGEVGYVATLALTLEIHICSITKCGKAHQKKKFSAESNGQFGCVATDALDV